MWHDVLSAELVGVGAAIEARVDGRLIAIFNLAGTFYATDAICTHAHAHLVEGYIEDEMVECPLHAAQFHIPTGRPLCAPATEPLRVYPVGVADGRILVEIAED